jgi:hypothetical protein
MNGTEIEIVLSTQRNAHADNQKTDMASGYLGTRHTVTR